MIEQPPQSRAQTRDAHAFRYRIIMACVHWGVVVLVIIAITVLRFRQELDNASVTALFGIILGHAGTVIGQRSSSRATDYIRNNPDH